jgi:hypothetical protein
MKKKQTTFVKIDFKTMLVGEEDDWGSDLFGLLAEANVKLILEVEAVPTHGGTSKYGRAIRSIHSGIIPKKWNDKIADRWAKVYRAELKKHGDSLTAAEAASLTVEGE